MSEQLWFSELSGDWNPVHVDEVKARRTLFGQPIVHGVHLLFWVIDELSRGRSDGVSRLRTLFLNPVFLGEDIELKGTSSGYEIVGKAGVAMTVFVEFGSKPKMISLESRSKIFPREPKVRSFEDAAEVSGEVHLYGVPELATRYPDCYRALGESRVATLCSMSRLVGMEFPGLNSLISSIELRSVQQQSADRLLRYRAVRILRRELPVRLEFTAPTSEGFVDTLFRPQPVSQPPISVIAKSVTGAEFRGQTALVVGGSRGLGEVVAKAVALGGGRVIVSYFQGERDAKRVAEEIGGIGQSCNVLRLNVLSDESCARLSSLEGVTHLYYMATPPIGRLSSDAGQDEKSRRKFDDFYIDGFRKVVETVCRSSENLRVFYPSSEAIVTHPSCDYSLSKLGGEQMCEHLARHCEQVAIYASRLPRVSTDQTVSLLGKQASSAVEVVLPEMRMLNTVDLGTVKIAKVSPSLGSEESL